MDGAKLNVLSRSGALAVAGLWRDAARTDTTDKVPLQRLTESLPLQSSAADAGPAHFRLTHGDALAIVKTLKHLLLLMRNYVWSWLY